MGVIFVFSTYVLVAGCIEGSLAGGVGGSMGMVVSGFSYLRVSRSYHRDFPVNVTARDPVATRLQSLAIGNSPDPSRQTLTAVQPGAREGPGLGTQGRAP